MLTGLVSDYNEYKKSPNITFIGVCTSTVGTVKTMADQVKRFGLVPFANMLDAGRATANSFGVPTSAAFRLVIIDPDGKIAYNAERGMFWTSGPDAGKPIHRSTVEKCLKTAKGILGVSPVPKPLETAAHYYDLQQFELLDQELTKVSALDKSVDVKTTTELMRNRMKEHREGRVKQIESLSTSDPVQAYREAIAFTEAFPRAPEMANVRAMGQKLLGTAAVKKEVDAEAGYQLVLVSEMKKVNNSKAFDAKIKPLLDGYVKKFADTKFVSVAQASVQAYGEALAKGGH